MHKTVRAAIGAMAVASILASATSCYGPFNLTRTVHKWNGTVKGSGEVSAKWMKEIIFLALVIVPVYQVSTLADALVFNSIEFWTGENPIKTAEAGASGGLPPASPPTVRTTVTRSPDGRTSRIEYHRGTDLLGSAQVVEEDHRYRLLTKDGEDTYSVEFGADGHLTLLDRQGRAVETFTPDRVEAVAATQKPR